MGVRCIDGEQWELERIMMEGSSNDAGSVSWLVGEHVIKPKMRSSRGGKRRTGKQRRKSAGAGGFRAGFSRGEGGKEARWEVTSCLRAVCEFKILTGDLRLARSISNAL